MKSTSLRLTLLAFSILLMTGTAQAATTATVAADTADAPAWSVREHYTKYEYRIPMRDGTRLFTVVYVPKDSSKMEKAIRVMGRNYP